MGGIGKVDDEGFLRCGRVGQMVFYREERTNWLVWLA
jgi:hypothetical protein